MMTALKPSLPPEAATPCASPVVLPDRAISAGETTTLWGADRGALRTCERRRAAAVAAANAGIRDKSAGVPR